MIWRRLLYLSSGLVLLAIVAFQLQHLLWSTARLTNDSAYLLSHVLLRVDDATVPVGDIAPGRSRFVRLPQRGDATLSVEFSSNGRSHRACSEYVEGEMYHVRVTISPSLAVACRAQLGVFTNTFMLFELF
jgi:hypothetical protein